MGTKKSEGVADRSTGGTSSTSVAVSSEKSTGGQQDETKQILKCILERDKQTVSDVKALKKIISKAGKKNDELKVLIQTKQKSVKAAFDDMAKLREEVRNFKQQMPKKVNAENSPNLRKNLEELVQQEKVEVARLEGVRQDLDTSLKAKATGNAASDAQNDDSGKALKKFSALVDELKLAEKRWQIQLASAMRDVSMNQQETAVKSGDLDGIPRIVEMVDATKNLKVELAELSKKNDEFELQKQALHSKLGGRLDGLRGLDEIRQKSEIELQKIVRQRDPYTAVVTDAVEI